MQRLSVAVRLHHALLLENVRDGQRISVLVGQFTLPETLHPPLAKSNVFQST
jgi:hypothetical protein